MKKHFLIILAFISNFCSAQIHEIGVFVGGSNLIGDIGKTNYIYPNKISGGVVYKYNLNPRIALRGNYTYIGLKGSDIDSDNPYRKARDYSFSNSIYEFAVGTEFNFFEYNIRNHKTSFTPYIMAQIAMFNYKSPVERIDRNTIRLKSSFSYAIPVGVGIKGRLSDNLAYGLESAVRFTFKDDLDLTTDKINNLNFGGTGNDFYVFTGFSIVYTFGRPPCFANLEE